MGGGGGGGGGVGGGAGVEGPCWMTAAGEPVASDGSLELSSPPAATDRERNIHP